MTATFTIFSTRTGSAASLLLDGDSGTQNIMYVDTKDNNATGGSALLCYLTTEGCVDSGNNTNWTFTLSTQRNNNHFFFLE